MLSASSPGLKTGIKLLAKAKGSVVEGEAPGRAVVAVEITLAVAHTDPISNKFREP